MIAKEEALLYAEQLEKAESSAAQCEVISSQIPNMTIDDAYEIQNAWVNMKIENGGKPVGHKIGLTSTVMQKAFGINEPDFGVLFDYMIHRSGAELKATQLIEPRIEAELAFKFKSDLPAKADSVQEVLACVESVYPALELIDFRVKASTNGTARTVKDTISDNAANCAVIMGESQIPLDANFTWIAAALRKNGIFEASGVAGAVLDHPVNSILWLNKKYQAYGRTIKAGETVLAGSFISPIPVKSGDEIEVDYNQFGKVRCRFV